ncbi:MAG: S8 family serine peptidase [Caldimonas sp.]
MIIVAVADQPDPLPAAGSTPRGYGGLPSYTGGDRASSAAAKLARDYRLREVSAWTIDPLRLRCMLYEIPAATDRQDILARLQHDDRVRLAQPLQSFDTFGDPELGAHSALVPAQAPGYNDPYVGLQHGFSAIGAGDAQHWASGAGVRVALIDTGVDARHPDLAGRVTAQHDFVTNAPNAPDFDRHGTEVAGVIAADANNGIGIVGIAPGVHILSYRACWPAQANASAARCDTFTLAQALSAAIESGANLINLSLGGPSDPLLEQLAGYAVKHGAIIVGAVPPNGRMDGFPVDVPGVIAVTSAEDPQPPGAAVLAAPGRNILTLEPGGHYDYASGSSLATAHVTGAIALLLQLNHRLDARVLFAALKGSQSELDAPINVCVAMVVLAPARGACTTMVARSDLGRAAR